MTPEEERTRRQEGVAALLGQTPRLLKVANPWRGIGIAAQQRESQQQPAALVRAGLIHERNSRFEALCCR